MDGWLEFLAVAQYGSFSKAADHLGLSKSHISKQVRELEEAFAIRLLNRTTRKVTLTEAGRLLFDRTRTIFDGAETARREILNMQAEPSGEIRISAAGVIGEEYISPFVAEFVKRYPRLKAHLNFSDRYVDLIGENYDLAIRVGNLQDSSLVAKRLVDRKEFVCASPSYLEKHGRPQRPKDLLKHNCLTFSQDPWVLEGRGGVHKLKVQGNFRSNNGRSLLNAALKGLGIIRLPGVYVNKLIAKGDLVPLLNEYNTKGTTIWIVYPEKRHLSTKVRVFVDALCQHFEAHYKGTPF